MTAQVTGESRLWINDQLKINHTSVSIRRSIASTLGMNKLGVRPGALLHVQVWPNDLRLSVSSLVSAGYERRLYQTVSTILPGGCSAW